MKGTLARQAIEPKLRFAGACRMAPTEVVGVGLSGLGEALEALETDRALEDRLVGIMAARRCNLRVGYRRMLHVARGRCRAGKVPSEAFPRAGPAPAPCATKSACTA